MLDAEGRQRQRLGIRGCDPSQLGELRLDDDLRRGDGHQERVGHDSVTGLVGRLGDDQWELQRQITRVFDPLGILNPGKVFAPDA